MVDAKSSQTVSSLISTIFAHTSKRSALRILDLGVGVGQTIEVVSEHRPCQFFFADVGRHVLSNDDGNTLGLLPFRLSSDMKFDVCFFWDYLNLMSESTFRRFSSAIEAFFDEYTLVHGFLAADIRLPMPYRQFKISARDTIERMDRSTYTSRYPKSRQDFERAFPSLQCERVVLFPENRQEVLAAPRSTR